MNKTKAVESFKKFLDTIEILRSENGCPWDKVQTPMSMRPDLIEEAFEASDAILENSPNHVKEELGDLFLNTLMVSYMFEQSGDFEVADVISELTEKLIRRHPHVFPESEGKSQVEKRVQNSEEVLNQWNKIKENVEKRKSDHILDEVPENFPVLLKAYKMQKKAAKKGFDWKESNLVVEKILEELSEVKEAENEKNLEFENAKKIFNQNQTVEPFTKYSTKKLDDSQNHVEEEIGDLLFSVVNYARHLGVNPEIAVSRTNKKFKNRFDFVETKMKENNIPMNYEHLKEMDEFWNLAKRV